MIKSELVQRMAARNPHLYQRDIENIVDAILGEIADALARGERVELRGFGAFSTKQRLARTGRNPRTGDKVPVTEKLVPFFKTGKEMRERLNAKPRHLTKGATPAGLRRGRFRGILAPLPPDARKSPVRSMVRFLKLVLVAPSRSCCSPSPSPIAISSPSRSTLRVGRRTRFRDRRAAVRRADRAR